ncbi:hypothetical protein F66182_6485 [Fusarium sp. NRRL 66182]|nr:hypothetical protein F66182_6485 [Fusarium sp. NRRL 66182]
MALQTLSPELEKLLSFLSFSTSDAVGERGFDKNWSTIRAFAPLSCVSSSQEPEELDENDILHFFDRLEKLEIFEYSNSVDLKLTAASAIVCARRGRILNTEEDVSFLGVCRSIHNRIDRYPFRWLPHGLLPPALILPPPALG